jgi:hypothetical protein
MSAWLDKIKSDLLDRHRMQQLLEPEKFKQEVKRVARGIEDVPVQKFIEQLQYIERELMPAVERRKGKDSSDYQFFEGLCRSLVWCIILCDRYDYLSRLNNGYRIDNAILKDHCRLLEGEIQKFCTLEDVFFTDFLDRYADAVKSRADALLNKGK